jgi:hypothetical protein
MPTIMTKCIEKNEIHTRHIIDEYIYIILNQQELRI